MTTLSKGHQTGSLEQDRVNMGELVCEKKWVHTVGAGPAQQDLEKEHFAPHLVPSTPVDPRRVE